MRKVIQMSQRQISGNGEEKSMSLQEVFLVNHSPSQAKERERMITAISGLTCSGPYMRSGPIGSLVRTLLASSRWYSPVRRLKWEVNPLYSERVSLYLKDINWKKPGLFAAGVAFGTAGIKILTSDDAKKLYTNCTAAVLRAKSCVMKTATSVQENAGDILAEAKQINEDRAAEAEAEVVDDFCETEETAEDTAEATEE